MGVAGLTAMSPAGGVALPPRTQEVERATRPPEAPDRLLMQSWTHDMLKGASTPLPRYTSQSLCLALGAPFSLLPGVIGVPSAAAEASDTPNQQDDDRDHPDAEQHIPVHLALLICLMSPIPLGRRDPTVLAVPRVRYQPSYMRRC